MSITKIIMTINADDLLNETDGINVPESASAYSTAVEAAIMAEYPDAEIEINLRNGVSGHRPSTMATSDDDINGWQECDFATDHADRIAAKVWEKFDWIVEL